LSSGGGLRPVKRDVACGILAAALSLIVVPLQSSDPSDVTSWSGAWEGTSQRVPAGTCVAGGLQKPQPTRVLLKVDADGTVIGGERPAGGGIEDGKALWRGRVEKTLKVRLVGPATASCEGQMRSYQIEYRGRIRKKDGAWRLELEGQDAGCAVLGCTFTRELKLTRP
jgi:hypothetical protein